MQKLKKKVAGKSSLKEIKHVIWDIIRNQACNLGYHIHIDI
jgi:hypothetical protein